MVKNVSVVIPLYNSKDSIADVLKGVESQTAANKIKEVVVVNDGSSDGSERVVEQYSKYSPLTIILISKTNGGVSSARNRGVKEAGSAEWIAFCDADDIWLPKKLERQFDCIRDHPNIDCIGCAFSERPLRIGRKIVNDLYKGSVRDICITNFPQPSTVLMKKSIFDEMGYFDENQRYAEDGNFFLRVAANYNLFYLPEQLIEYGYGKRGFGVKGLSSNLKGMYHGNVKNLKEMKSLGYISSTFYYQMRIYHFAKYIRRIMLSLR